MARCFRARWWLALLPLLALAFVFGPGCGKDKTSGPSDGSVELPAAWAGIWEIESTERACGSSTIDYQDTETDTLCAGEEIDFSDGDVDPADVNCEGTVTDTKVDVTCTSSGTVEGITYTVSVDVTINGSGDDMNGTARFTTKIGDEQVDCTENTLVRHRIAPAPNPCVSSSATFLDRRIESAVADAFGH